MKKALIVISVLLIIMGIWGFGQQEKSDLAIQTRLATDFAARTITIPKNPQRVIALNSSHIDLYYAAGGKVIARPSRYVLREEVAEQVKDLPSFGDMNNPSVEQIVALKPDLVLGLTLAFNQNLIAPLEKVGIPVLLQPLDTYEDILTMLNFFGELTGNPNAVAQVKASLQKKTREALAKNKGNYTPDVVIIYGMPENYTMALPNSFTGDLIKILGANNIAANHSSIAGRPSYAAFNMEFIVKANPDFIFFVAQGSGQHGGKMKEALAKHPSWQNLKAVKAGKAYVLPFRLFGISPGIQAGEAIEYLSDILYKEKP